MSWLPAGSLEVAGLVLDFGWDLPETTTAPLWPVVERTVTVPFTPVDFQVVALAFGVPLALVDPARLAAENRLRATEPDRWADDGGAPCPLD